MAQIRMKPIPRDAAVAAPIIVAARVGGRASDPASLTTACSHAPPDPPGPPSGPVRGLARAGYRDRRVSLPSRRFPVNERALAASHEPVRRGPGIGRVVAGA